jgi:hypothetical protein
MTGFGDQGREQERARQRQLLGNSRFLHSAANAAAFGRNDGVFWVRGERTSKGKCKDDGNKRLNRNSDVRIEDLLSARVADGKSSGCAAKPPSSGRFN